MNVVFRGSPNYAPRKVGIDRIVVHWFGSGTLESADARFQNKDNKVSAHYGISKGRVWQWVFEKNAAWHAGNLAMNDRSVGIEHDATLNGHDLSEADYKLSGELIAGISKRYNIPLDRQHVIQHKQVKPTQCPGTVDLDKIIAIAKTFLNPTPMKLRVQLVFNHQHYSNEASLLAQANDRMKLLTNNLVELEFLPIVYTECDNIPTLIYQDGLGSQYDRAVSYDWLLLNVYAPLKDRKFDALAFVGPFDDWESQYGNVTTFGHYYSNDPTVAPFLIQILAGEHDNSWKWNNLNAFVHYLTHELAHPIMQATGQDRVHEFDYASENGLQGILPTLNYSLISELLARPTDYMSEYPLYKKEGDGTLYASIGGMYLLPIAADFNKFVQDFPGHKIITLSSNEFLLYRIAAKTLIKDR